MSIESETLRRAKSLKDAGWTVVVRDDELVVIWDKDPSIESRRLGSVQACWDWVAGFWQGQQVALAKEAEQS